MTTLITGTLDTLPAAPDPATDAPATFSTKAAAMVLAIKTMVTQLITIIAQMNTVTTEVNTNATSAASSASTASAASTAASTAAGATLWASGTYATGVCVYSPITWATYRRTSTSPGASAADPSTAPTLWVRISGGDLIPALTNSATAAVAGYLYVIYGACALTLPAIGTTGQRIGIIVLPGVTGVTVIPAGTDKIRASAGTMTLDVVPWDKVLTDSGATNGWV